MKRKNIIKTLKQQINIIHAEIKNQEHAEGFDLGYACGEINGIQKVLNMLELSDEPEPDKEPEPREIQVDVTFTLRTMIPDAVEALAWAIDRIDGELEQTSYYDYEIIDAGER